MFSSLVLLTTAQNNRPILGVLTQPLGQEPANQSYIAASYVKFIESAGARVVPVHYDSSAAELKTIFRSINGILFPGGGVSLANTTQIRRSGQILYDLAIAANDRGDPFPIWGTCMGFQFLSLLTAQNDSILCSKCYDSEGTPLPLSFLEPAASRSNLYGGLPQDLKHALASQKLTENSHHDGILPSTFKSDARLAAFYTVLSTNVDTSGHPFVSSFEAKHYPIAGTQWHPEKNNFEWSLGMGPGAIPHGATATAVSQYMANYVVGQARRSLHKFPSPEAEAAALIYNYPPLDGSKLGRAYFDQVYIFDRSATLSSRR